MNIRLLVFAFCLVLIAGTVPTTAAQAGGEYGEANCITDGGAWSGTSGVAGTGICEFVANSSVAVAACGADKTYVVGYSSGIPNSSACNPIALDARGDCIAAGGSWTGSSAQTGQCYYDPTTSWAMAFCRDFAVLETWTAGVATDIRCISPTGPAGEDGDDDDEPEDEVSTFETSAVMLTLGGDNHSDVTFPPSACPQKCTVSRALPAGAKSSLPGDALDMMYVRVVGQDGSSTGGSYTVCFENSKGTAVVIYKFVGDAWVPLTFASTLGRVCVNSTGEGAFYVGD